MKQAGQTEIRALLLALGCAVLLLVAVRALGAANVQTWQVSVGPTPAAMGNSINRGLFELAVPTAAAGAVDCGPHDMPLAQWWRTNPGGTFSVGILYRGTYTANKVIKCYVVTQTTPVVVQVKDEGGMPPPTPTNTP